MRVKWNFNIIILIGLLFGSACNRAPGAGTIPVVAVPLDDPITHQPTATLPSLLSATATVTLLPTIPVTPSPTQTVQPTLTWTPDPYAGYRIEDLARRSYGGGELVVESILAENNYFTRMLISYPSDGLKIYGFMNVPKKGTPPHPVIIAIHGYIEPEIYDTLDYTTRYADTLARSGYLVLHPNLRGYPPSDSGDNLFRVGMAVDVLNLIALVRAQGGQAGALTLADPAAIGLWGHSMGGGISTRVLTVDPDVKAAVLYGAMSGDEKKNYERIFQYFSNGTRGWEELLTPDEIIQDISPINYLDRIQAAVSIHHGANDPDVPPDWSQDLCDRLKALGKPVECFTYKGQAHTFRGEGDDLFNMRMVQFYDSVLRE
jgi:dipeptidyl aminopeptidase/acylaminoacyl peptidase